MPPFYPDAARPYLSEIEAKALFERFETICQKTGYPWLPMMLLPFLLLPILTYIMVKQFTSEAMFEEEEDSQFNYSTIIAVGVTFVVLFLLLIIFWGIMARKRKSQLTALFEEWNKTEGVPKGLFFELGDPSGPSVDKFWNGFYPTTFNIGNNTTLTILTE